MKTWHVKTPPRKPAAPQPKKRQLHAMPADIFQAFQPHPPCQLPTQPDQESYSLARHLSSLHMLPTTPRVQPAATATRRTDKKYQEKRTSEPSFLSETSTLQHPTPTHPRTVDLGSAINCGEQLAAPRTSYTWSSTGLDLHWLAVYCCTTNRIALHLLVSGGNQIVVRSSRGKRLVSFPPRRPEAVTT